jgi:2-polyprenyl-3-methyl-5-hydroxy-6-metoxy-1,4-benzoquinol methylase
MIRGGHQGKARLRLIGDVLRPSTLRLLRAAGITQGMACLDVGCGGGDVTLELARLVGPRGRVVGIDIDTIKLELARQEAEHEQLPNVAFQVFDATALDTESNYDLVYARFLLTHLRDPQTVLRQIVRAAKPGGAIVLEDINHDAIFCYPPCAALDRYISLYNQVALLKGADPQIGLKLPELLRLVGAHAIGLNVVQPAFTDGAGKRIHQITLENISEAIIAGGLATPPEIRAIAAELDVLTQNPHSLIGFPRIFQVWGYRGPAPA